MTFTVQWTTSAEDELAGLWTDASARDEITQAAAEIDRTLRDRPMDCGESRPGGERITLAAPLGILYRLNEQDRFVHVLHVWRFRTPRRRG